MSRLQTKNKSYEEFVKKFKPKKTTDDCYTPPHVYEVIKDWAIKEYGWWDREILRPFWPGADYRAIEYPDNSAVIDNPPFSIISEIVNFYEKRGIDYFLFAPHLTCLNLMRARSHIVAGVDIIFENGANVKTSFVGSKGPALRSAPTLRAAVAAEIKKAKRPRLQRYEYPPEVVTASKLEKLSRCGIEFETDRVEFVRGLDSQKPYKKRMFGAGYLVSAADSLKLADSLKQANRGVIVWELSDREREIVKTLGE